MALNTPNIEEIAKRDPKLAEALKKQQDYINKNVSPAQGNRLAPPAGFVKPV